MRKNRIKSVVTVNDYGKVHIHLKEVLESKHMTRYGLAKAVDTRFEVIKKWYDDDVERLDLDILARICYVLDCSPSDIITYEE